MNFKEIIAREIKQQKKAMKYFHSQGLPYGAPIIHPDLKRALEESK